MSKQNLFAFAVILAFLQLFFATDARAQRNDVRSFKERLVIESVRTVSGAQFTYQATAGAGTFGSLANLRQVQLIDDALASGEKHGYVFALSVTPPTANAPARFALTATPQRYPKAGRHSFFINESGELRGADKNGAPADASDPLIEPSCAFYGILYNERCVISDMRSLHGAQMTYQATNGNGSYGTLAQLFAAGLINSRTASGTNYDYNFELTTTLPVPGFPASFRLRVTPVNYGVTGVRSFYIDASGVLRGADKQGLPADGSDPPIND